MNKDCIDFIQHQWVCCSQNQLSDTMINLSWRQLQHIPLFFLFVSLPCVLSIWKMFCASRLTSTALKRSSNSSSGGTGSLPAACFCCGPAEPGAAAFPSFPWDISALPAAFPIIIYPINSNHKKKVSQMIYDSKAGLFPSHPKFCDPWLPMMSTVLIPDEVAFIPSIQQAEGWNSPHPLSERQSWDRCIMKP